MQPAAPSSALLAGLSPSLRLAGTRISLGLSLPCVFQTGSAGLSVTCRRVPGWKSEVAPVAARGARRKPVPGEESALREQGGRLVQVRGWVASPRAGRWAVTQSVIQRICSSRAAASLAVPFLGCAPLAAFCPGRSLQTLWLCYPGALDPGDKARGSTRRPRDLPRFLTHPRQELSRLGCLCPEGFPVLSCPLHPRLSSSCRLKQRLFVLHFVLQARGYLQKWVAWVLLRVM